MHFVEVRLSAVFLAGAITVSIAVACSDNGSTGGTGQGSTTSSGGASTGTSASTTLVGQWIDSITTCP